MKLLRIILCLLIILPATLIAQNSKSLTKKKIGEIGDVNGNIPNVRIGEFKIDLGQYIFEDNARTHNYKYYVIIRDENDKPVKVLASGVVMDFSAMNQNVEILRAGYTIKDYVYIKSSNVIESGQQSTKCYLIIGGDSYGPYDTIKEVLPEGFVYKYNDIYSYMEYDNMFNVVENYSVLEKATYEGEFVQCSLKNEMLKFTPKNKVNYYKCYDGHYYILYNDKAMSNTLFIVDGVGMEIDEVVDKLNFKFSHNGDHWIASGNNYVIVDGVFVVRNSQKIKDICINNNGDYVYIIEGEGSGDKVFVNDKALFENVDVLGITVDNNQRFNYVFRNDKGCYYVIDNSVINYNDRVERYYYPSLFYRNREYVVKSDDGEHSFVYNRDLPYILIDSNRIDCSTTPQYVIWSESEKSFMWNAVDEKQLMVYKYKVR